MAIRAVGCIDEHRRRLLDLDLAQRAVGDPVREQALDRVDVALARVHLLVPLVEEPPVGLLVERSEEVEVILGHLAHRHEHRLEPLGAVPLAGDRGPERRPEGVLVVARQQGEDLVAAEPTPVQRHPRQARFLGDPRQRRRLPAAGGNRPSRALDHALLGVAAASLGAALDLRHRG